MDGRNGLTVPNGEAACDIVLVVCVCVKHVTGQGPMAVGLTSS